MLGRLGERLFTRRHVAELLLWPKLAYMWAGAALASQRSPAIASPETLPATLPPQIFTGYNPDRLQDLVHAYPELRLEMRITDLIWPDGEVMACDDGSSKSFAEALANPDLQDQLALSYPRAMPTTDRPPLTDPGRIRFEPFFRKTYGATLSEVRRNLVPVHWLPRHNGPILWFTRVNGVAVRAGRISEMLQDLSDELLRFVGRPGGSFFWRQIAGTSHLSSHSFGIAIDIGTADADYWRWHAQSGDTIRYVNRVPAEIVRIFESEGFIWGGKWYHFDTMHFEYRPELLP